MNVLAPVRRDRVISDLPPCFRKEAALHTRPAFHPTVASACQEQRTGTVGSVGAPSPRPPATPPHLPCPLPFPPRWDTAGQERFKCIASTYYRGAQAIVIVFDVNDVGSLEHTRQWLADALKENDPSNVILFLVGSKKDLSSPAQYSLMEKDALKVAQEMQAEYWAVSSLTGESQLGGVGGCRSQPPARFRGHSRGGLFPWGRGERAGFLLPRISSNESDLYLSTPRKKPKCCQ
ncbi:RAB34 protein, partial [Mohoua ochrocephala]|nr:RAB34 protein [Mohoua ochrocephala]